MTLLVKKMPVYFLNGLSDVLNRHGTLLRGTAAKLEPLVLFDEDVEIPE